jgi:oxygen-dependent protoporphyrinogen oxidase
MARIVDALLALMPGVDVRHGRSVVAIEADPSPAAPAARAGSGPPARVVLDDGTTLDADAVVVACPAHVAAPLLAPLSADAGTALAAIDHASVTLVTLAFGEGGLAGALDASGCLVPRDQGTLLTAISYATSKWAQLRNLERDDAILRVSAGRFGDDRHLDLDDDDLTAALLADLDRIIGVRADPTEVRVNRWARSFPQYAPGHLERVDAIDAALGHLPVVVAGAAYRGLGVPACVRQGEEAAAALGATWPTPARLT